MHPTLNIAKRAAHNAGNIMMRALNRLDTLNVTEKSQNDYVSEVDRMAEQEIVAILRKAYPQHGILGEEGGVQQASGSDEFQWIIDPLDGTTNYLRGIPHFAVSIALKHKNQITQALVYDPVKDETFMASRGNGAQLNDRRIRVTNRKTMEGALLGTGFPFRADQDVDLFIETLRVMMPQTAGIRRPGSAALDLAYVAAGRFDGFWEFGLNSWDMAAGSLLVQEAGGVVTDLKGGDDFLSNGNILAGNIRLHLLMMQRLAKVIP
ncbi:MAG: inositol monophosphatase [Gammaproteobacteria bacterium]|nr:inositol monophosphatase [Gammaproteobacteria bacterium]